MLPFDESKKKAETCSSDKRETFLKIKSESEDEDLIFYPVFHDTIPEEYKHCPEQILNETADNKTRGIRHLKEVMEREKKTCPSEDFLIMVLRGCKYDIKKSESKLKRLMKLRQETANHLAKTEMKKIEIIVDDVAFGVLPYRDKFGRTVLFTRANHHLDLYTIEDALYCYSAFLMFALTFPMSAVCGISYINDSETDSPLSYLRVVKDSRKIGIDLMLSLPARYGRIDFIHEMSVFRWILMAILTILPQKIVGRILFHGSDLKSLCKAYHPRILPSEFGGDLGPISNACYRQRFLDFVKGLRNEKK